MKFSFLFNETAPTEIYTLSLHDALPIYAAGLSRLGVHQRLQPARPDLPRRSEEHTSELQSRENLVCRLLLEKKKNIIKNRILRSDLCRSMSINVLLICL